MRAIFVLLVPLVLVASTAADIVTIEEIDLEVHQIDNISVNSDYDASTGELTWSQGGIATLYHDQGSDIYRVVVGAVWGGVTDLSADGHAAASFATGSFDITLYAMSDPGKTNPLGNMSGELFPGWSYLEGETNEETGEGTISHLYGAAPMRLTVWDVNGYDWSENLGDMGGITASTSNLFNTWADIDDYQSDWWSDNTIVTLLADETGIPEPATIALLGLGALAVIRKKRS